MTKKILDISRKEIETLVQGFTDHSLPADGWTHEAHLITGLWLTLKQGASEAESVMPNMIKSFNEAKGGINSDTEGYHHTITIFYLRILEKFRIKHNDLTDTELVTLMLADPLARKMYPLNFYSKDLLFSVEARLRYVAPDLPDLSVNG